MESRFWRRAARRRLGRFLIKIRRSASACVIACSVARILSSWREGDDRRERREGDSRKPRPRRRPPLAGETHVAPPIEGSHWGARVVAVGTRRRRPFRRGEGGREGWGEKASERGREPRTTSVPLRISFRALVRASEVPSPPLLLSSPLASLLSRRRGSSLCRGRSPPPRPTTTRTTPATRGAAAAAAAATTRHK